MSAPGQESAPRRSLLRSILTVATGSALGSIIAFGASPLLTRLFTPAEFGVFSVLTALVLILVSLVTGRLELAVPLPRDDSEARDVLLVGMAIAATSITLLVALELVAPDLVALATPGELDGMTLAVPLMLAPVACYTLLSAWAIRQSRYRALATRNVGQALATAALQVSFGLAGYGAGGLVAGYVAGQVVGTVALLYRSGLRGSTSPTRESFRAAGRKYRRHPLILAPTGVVNALGSQAPVLIVAATYGTAAAGLLGLSVRVLAVPVALVGQATAQVYISELARSHRSDAKHDLLPLFWRTTRVLALAATGLIVLGSPVVYWSFSPVFGDAWSDAGTLAALLTVGVGAQLLGSPVSQTLVVLNRLGTLAAWDVSRLLATVIVLVVAWRADLPLWQAIAALSVLNLALYSCYWYLSYRTLVAHCAKLPT